jgi:hypothetical protein
MLQMQLEVTDKNTLIGECQLVLSFQLTADPERRKQLTERDGMLVVHVLCIMFCSSAAWLRTSDTHWYNTRL